MELHSNLTFEEEKKTSKEKNENLNYESASSLYENKNNLDMPLIQTNSVLNVAHEENQRQITNNIGKYKHNKYAEKKVLNNNIEKTGIEFKQHSVRLNEKKISKKEKTKNFRIKYGICPLSLILLLTIPEIIIQFVNDYGINNLLIDDIIFILNVFTFIISIYKDKFILFIISSILNYIDYIINFSIFLAKFIDIYRYNAHLENFFLAFSIIKIILMHYPILFPFIQCIYILQI